MRGALIGWLLVGLVLGGAGTAEAADDGGLTLLVVPARYSVLQVMFDVLRRRDAALVSYQGDAQTARPVLHAWNGAEWVYVSLSDYARAGFIQQAPDRVVLVGDAELLPPVLAERSSWCPVVLNVANVTTPGLVNACGRLFDFTPEDWKWFAARYNMNLEDVASGQKKDSWYYHPYQEDRIPGLWESIRGAGEPGARSASSPPPRTVLPARELPPAPVVVEPGALPPPNAMWERPTGDTEP